MDLYSGGGSISQANSQTASVRQANQDNQDFNNSLAAQIDQANTNLDEASASKNNKNLLSIGTSGGKLTSMTYKKAFGGAATQTLPKNFNVPKAGDVTIGADNVETSITSNPVVDRVPVGTEATEVGSEATDVASDVASEAENAIVDTSKEAATLGEDAFKAAAIRTGKAAIAGAGGVIDLTEDISRAVSAGGVSMKTFGSNTSSQVGNILNVAGSGLEVAGIATGGITPWSIAAEGLGAVLGLAGGAAELFGDVKQAATDKTTTDQDLSSQTRGEVGVQKVTQVTARSN
mgnify:FL=1